MTSAFSWVQQNKYSWRGTVNNIAYWVILTLDNKSFILQQPGIFNAENGLVNKVFSSFNEAMNEAETSYRN